MITSFAHTICMLLLGIVLQTQTSFPIHFLAAPCVMMLYTASQSNCMLVAFASGLMLDCLTLTPYLGFMGISWLIAMRFLYPWRLYFFKDSLSTLAIMTYLYMLLTSITEGLVALLLDVASPLLSLRWFISDVLLMPLADAIWGSVTSLLLLTVFKKITAFRKV